MGFLYSSIRVAREGMPAPFRTEGCRWLAEQFGELVVVVEIWHRSESG